MHRCYIWTFARTTHLLPSLVREPRMLHEYFFWCEVLFVALRNTWHSVFTSLPLYNTRGEPCAAASVCVRFVETISAEICRYYYLQG